MNREFECIVIYVNVWLLLICYCISAEKSTVKAERVKGACNPSAVQQHQNAEKYSHGSSLRIYFKKHSAKLADSQCKTTPAAARTQVNRSNLSAVRTTHKSDSNEYVSRRSPTQRQSSVKCPMNGPSCNMETASISMSGKQSVAMSRGASRAFCNRDIIDNTDCQNNKRGSHRMNSTVSLAFSRSERNGKIEKVGERDQVNRSPPNTAGCQHQCLHQVYLLRFPCYEA